LAKAYTKLPDKGDPSDVLQLFPRFNLQLLCCRYWWLKRWEFRELSFPYWRVYHNNHKGAVIIYNGREYALLPDKILMIAPSTSYSTRIGNSHIPEEGYRLEGGRLGKGQSEAQFALDGSMLHLFIHFNIGVPYDHVSPGVFEFDLTDHLLEKLSVIKKHLNVDFARFNFYTVLAIQSLISDLLSFIPESNWDLVSKDYRIIHVLSHIESNLDSELSNSCLAGHAKLATNAFNRLFTDEVGTSPQKFVKKKRIDKACALLHHSNYSIEQVAAKTGFADRYHFSKIFKQLTELSPARYRKEFGVK
jgi:AraC-like DNA-binding protein